MLNFSIDENCFQQKAKSFKSKRSVETIVYYEKVGTKIILIFSNQILWFVYYR